MTSRAASRGITLPRMSRDTLFLAALLAVALLPRLPTLGQPLLEWHGFRQTWTAWTAKLFHERGVDLLHPLVPIFGPPFVLPSELPLFQALGALVMALGVPTDAAMRVAGLATFLACAVALWLLARDVADRPTAFVAVALFAATPLAMLESRAAMIEYLALGAGLAYLWAGLRWRDRRRARWWLIALALGLVAALVKPPTFVACAIPLALAVDRVQTRGVAGWLRARLDPRVVVLGLLPLAAAFAWIAYGDAVKASQPATAFLQSTGPLWRWYYYATLADRVSAAYVDRVSGFLADLTIGRFMLPFVVAGLLAAVRAPRASVWLGLGLSVALPIAVFWGAYQLDYYFIAVSAQTAMLAALGLVWAWRRARVTPGRAVIGLVALVAVVASLASARDYWTVMYDAAHDPEHARRGAELIAANTRPDELVVVLGLGYNPERLFYADRSGLMLVAENIEATLPTIDRARYRTLYVIDPWADPLWIARSWRWVGARESSIYRVSDGAAGVADAYLIATDEASALPAPADARVLADRPITVPCDFNGADVPAGRRGTLLVLRAGYPRDARLAVGYVSGPVPARAAVWFDGAFTSGASAVRVTCAGAPQLVIERVLDSSLAR